MRFAYMVCKIHFADLESSIVFKQIEVNIVKTNLPGRESGPIVTFLENTFLRKQTKKLYNACNLLVLVSYKICIRLR